MLNRLEDVIKQVKIEESLKKEKEFEALQYQLNPHFLYNTLNTIKWVAKIHKTPQISEVVSALVRLLQVSLNKKGDFITVREEFGLVKDYMDIQTFRYGETIQIESDIDPLAAQCLVPTMILQPLVENAIIHGLDQSNKEDKRILIRAWIERDLLFCQVEDNGRGLNNEQLLFLDANTNKSERVKEKLSGIGLNHIREKIRLYYGPDYSMQIFSKPNQGTTVKLSLPIHQSEE
jgi:sensor histidine kinase YesM